MQKVGRKPTNRVLYIIGDSFLADKTLSGAFDSFDNTIFLDRRFPFGPIRLDATKQNYLIMEFAERNLVDYDINTTQETRFPVAGMKPAVNGQPGIPGISDQKALVSTFDRLCNIIFNKDLSHNLELILFDNTGATPFKEVKASLNYSLFGRVTREVAVSSDKKRLFLNITVDTASKQSAFRAKTSLEIKYINKNLGIARDYYRSIGFKNIFLSIIPNAVSVYDEKRMHYNHLLEHIEQHSPMPVISVMDIFITDKRNLFYRSDAHWNPVGLDIWVSQTDKVLTSDLN